MKILDILGTILGVIAYLLIINGMVEGFILGIIASSLLVIVGINKKLVSLWGLQGFLVCANIYAVINFGGF